MSQEKIAVLGGGTWGATLAVQLAEKGHDVIIWEFVPAVAEHLQKNRTLKTLPQLKIPSSVRITNDLREAFSDRSILLSVTPSHTVRATFERCKKEGLLKSGMLVISASKGIENESFMSMGQIIRGIFPDAGDIVILSGPSHAEEVALKKPVALVAASESKQAAAHVQQIFVSDNFRVYTGTDPLGVELGGALKNVYAIGCGIVDGLAYGDNTKAAVITRGLLEMTKLGTTLGASTMTFFGLSGLGDMIVTCGSQHSRNRQLGEKIGQGKTLQQALSEMTMVAEGVNTAKSAYHLAKRKGIDMPIVNEVYRVLYENKTPRESIKDLMSRQVGAELEGIVL